MDDILKQLLQEEQELEFDNFNESTAWQLGSQMVERAMSESLPVTIDIRRGGHQLFHASMKGTSADNDEWVSRKVRLVNRFGHSSIYMGQLLNNKGRSIEETYLISEGEFAPHGGCFPIIVKGYWHGWDDHRFRITSGRRSQAGGGIDPNIFKEGKIT